jgi:hypothetical protein
LFDRSGCIAILGKLWSKSNALLLPTSLHTPTAAGPAAPAAEASAAASTGLNCFGRIVQDLAPSSNAGLGVCRSVMGDSDMDDDVVAASAADQSDDDSVYEPVVDKS